MDEQLKLLKELCMLFGPSGCEGNVRDYIRDILSDTADEIILPKDGSLIAVIKGDRSTGRRIMLDAHMDEVGFMVTHIDDEGYIRFTGLSRLDSRVICGRKVTFGDENKRITGIVASKAIHQQSSDERKRSTAVENMYIDIGSKSKEETLKYVEPGDFGTFDCDFVQFGDGFIRSKALDDRLGCAVLINTAKKLADDRKAGKTLPYDVYFAFTTREEVGKSGSRAAAYRIKPEFAIVLECTAVHDVSGVPAEKQVGRSGEGGLITLVDEGTLFDINIVNFAMDTAKKYGIKSQLKRFPGGSNNSAYIQKSGEGAKVLTVSAPGRYIHTPSVVVREEDYRSVSELVYALVNEWNTGSID